MSDDRPGYTDTPRIPGSEYRVHDPDRPAPPTVDPGRPGTSAAPGEPPSDATVLFDGTDLRGWEGADGGDADWLVEDDYMEVVPGAGDVRTAEGFGDCHLHVEWATPADVDGEGQGRGNSGVFLMDRYEIQVLDCYGNDTYADGYAAAVYGQHPPLVDACREPGAWQTYDVLWRGPRFRGEEFERPARVTLLHNGIVAHHRTDLVGPTTHRDVTPYSPHPPEGPLRLQDHGDPVRFRNVWYRPLPE
jgi:hypothetical protein